MSESKEEIVKNLFQGIIEFLKKKEDGSYIFRNDKYQFSSSVVIDRFMSDLEFSNIPSYEELCSYFEKAILPIIPHATLFINNELSITINIKKNPEFLKKIYLAKKELDIYESIKTLFFPTMKEFVVKFSNSHPEYIYSPSRKFKVEIYNIDEDGSKQEIRFASLNSKRMRPIDNAAIEFLIEDINYHISYLKFRNPIPTYAIKLPQKDITIEQLKSEPKGEKKGFNRLDFYSYNQKIKFIRELFEDFLKYYTFIIDNNFLRIRNAFPLYNEFPIIITIYTEKIVNPISNLEDIKFTITFNKLPAVSGNKVVLEENQKCNEDFNLQFPRIQSYFSVLLIISHFGSFRFTGHIGANQFHNPYNAQRNALPYTYRFIKEELYDILEKIQSDSIFDDIKPYIAHADSWIQTILAAEKRGSEDYNIELKRIPTESKKKDGSGNDIYSEINAFENSEGGYLFIGVDEKKNAIDKIVGLEGYFRDQKKNIDIVKREIIDKCFKYLGKTYRIDSDTFEGKSLIRIKVSSNYGNVSWFKPESGNPCAFFRENGKKRIMRPEEIENRLRRNN